MRYWKYLAGLVLTGALVACGGGGGSAGTPLTGTGSGSGTTTTTVTAAATPTVALELQDATGKTTTTVSNLSVIFAKATVKTSTGAVVTNTVVTFSGDASLVKFNPLVGTALTDGSGIAMVQIMPALATSAGAGSLKADATVGGVAAVQAAVNFQVPSGGSTGVASMSLGLRDSTNASTTFVDSTSLTYARVTLLDAAGSPVANTLVTFAGDASLIKFSPAGGTVLTNATGVATIQVSPASPSSAGAGTLRASATVSSNAVGASFDYQIASVGSAGVPTLKLGLRDASNSPTNVINASGVTTARATVLDATGAPVAGKVVTFTGDATLIKFNPATGQVLTDASGVASVQVSPATLSSAGASTLNASTALAGVALATSFDYQLTAANLTLSSLNLGSPTLAPTMAAYGNRPVSVIANINGAPATNTPIQVTFAASCGTVNPASVSTDGTGVASTTYKANDPTCAGTNVSISAAAVGATSQSGSIAVQASLATNVQFVSATPQLIYLTGSVGATQAQVVFKVVDSTGNPLQNQPLVLSLVNTGPGVTLNTVGNTATVTLTSDAAGLVSAPVFSGTVPTSVQVKAVLGANASVFATSNILTVASGRPVQRAASVSLSKFSIEGLNIDGVTSRVTISLADRQGNPVPDGTQINFTTKYGLMIPAFCLVSGGTSSCAVDIRAQGDRKAPFEGRVAILAYVPGEEDFVDLNFNNVYDPGEPFTDLGNAYRDEYPAPVGTLTGVVDGTYTTGEFTVPRAGSSVCMDWTSLGVGTPNGGGVNGRDGTCDGVWGTVDVRVQTKIIFASSAAVMTLIGTPTVGGFLMKVADVNGNSMPTGSTLSAEKLSGSDNCTVKKTFPATIPNTYDPTIASVSLDKCIAGDVIGLTVTSPSGLQTLMPATLQ